MLWPIVIGESLITTKENTTKPGKMSTGHKVLVFKFTQDFSSLFVKPRGGKNERGRPISPGSIDYIL